jgi:hypothetical protein
MKKEEVRGQKKCKNLEIVYEQDKKKHRKIEVNF